MKLDGIREKVFLDRYSLKDEKGNPMEKTPDQMWKRVAKGVVAAEKKKNRGKWEKKFYEAMQGFKFVPGGRILAGAGTGFDVTFYNCLPPDQEVLTPQGYVPIREIKVGDKVITGKKRARKVKHIFIRKTEEPVYVIKPTKLGFDKVRLTGEHPILAIKKEWVNTHRDRDGLRLREEPQWIKAAHLKKGDFVAVGWNEEIAVDAGKTINLKDYLPQKFTSADGYITKSQLKKPVRDAFEIDEKFMLLAGTWLGDGCVTHRTGTDIPTGIQITFNSSQKEWATEIVGILEEKYEVIPTIREDRWGQKLIQVRVESFPVGLFFKSFFGAYSCKKRIPQILAEQPSSLILPLIKGLFRSDGYLTKNVLGIAISNKALAIQLHQLILRAGKFFTIFKNNAVNGKHGTYRLNAGISQANGFCEYIFGEDRKNNHHNQNYYLEHDGLYWVRIDALRTEAYKGDVYDLEVEEDHSFITGGIVVSNCFVLPSPKDSRDGIIDNLKAMIEIMAHGGGAGINLSSLRPRGARVKKVNGFSSGPCNWAELYSLATHDIIQQGGSRRGALMLMLWDWHPDIEEFITVKQDLKRITGANLSVCVSDSFMEAVRKDAKWDLVFPDLSDKEYDEKWDGVMAHWKGWKKKVKVYKTIKARYLWNLICEAAWKSAEPGIVFLERYNKWYNNWYWNTVNCTNPCVSGETLVSTTTGIRTIRELYKTKNPFTVVVDGKYYLSSSVKLTGVKPVYRLVTKEGYELRLTLDHKVYTNKGKIEAGKLKKGDSLLLSKGGAFSTKGTLEEGRVLGWLVGDGSMKEDVATLYFYRKEKQELAPSFALMVNGMVGEETVTQRDYSISPQYIDREDKAVIESVRLWRVANRFGITHQNKYVVPKEIFAGSEEIQRGFLQGLFSSDGSVQGNIKKGVSVRLTSVSKSLLKDTQKLLLNFGIISKLYLNRRAQSDRMLPDGKGGLKTYTCKAYHELVISNTSLRQFAALIGFLQEEKQEKLRDLLSLYTRGPYRESFFATFDSLEEDGVEEVFDITVADIHRFCANGLIISNCGEEGLPSWGVCNLSSLNLANFVEGYSVKKAGEMDYKSLAEYAKIGVRLQDDVIDLDNYVFPQIRQMQLNGERRVGLGTMGLGDALIKMHLRYGSAESLKVIEKIYKTIRDAAYEASADLAREKGPFPKFNARKYLQGYFIKKLPVEIRAKIKKYGIRNSLLLQEAPTGSTSLLSGVSSGIEPIYEFEFIRKDRLGEHKIYHPLYEEWKKANLGSEKPDYFVSANDLSPEEHIKVQSTIQQYVDASISKTVNAPKTHKVEDVKKLYELAYELGCKGITYMREGSREGVLTRVDVSASDSADKKEQVIQPPIFTPTHPILARPEKIEGVTYRTQTPMGEAFITINHDDKNEPFEMFVTIGKSGSDVNAMAEALGRMVSLNLRLSSLISPRERIRQVISQLAGIGGARSVGFGKERVRSLPDAVAKVLAKHFGFVVNGKVEDKKSPINGDAKEALAKKSSEKNGEGKIDKDNNTEIVVLQQLSIEGDGSGISVDDASGALSELSSATSLFDICPDCGSGSLAYEEGCRKCYSCGYSEC